MVTDIRGLPLSGADTEQAAAYDAVLQEYFDYRISTFPSLKPLCETGPDFSMAHILKGYLLLSMGMRDTVSGALARHQHVSERSATLTPREALHLQALGAWARGNTIDACRIWDDILFQHPLDLLALKLQHFTLFWAGRSQHMCDAAARVLPAWEESTPGYAHVLGMYAFGLEETNNYAKAERFGREAVAKHPDDLWAIHAIAHVLEMQGRLSEGIDWLQHPFEHWQDRNPFKAHLWWHLALFAYEKGDFERALEIYDLGVRPADTLFYLDIQNTASLLARLTLTGFDVGDRWNGLAEAAQNRQGDHSLVFTEPHCAMVFGATGDFDAAAQQIASLTTFSTDAENSGAPLVEPIVIPLCSAIRDFHNGKYAAVVEQLLPLRYNFQPVGGSHAQRDIFALYLIAAAMRDGKLQLAKALLSERVARYHNTYIGWQNYAQVCEKLGDDKTLQYGRMQLERVASIA